MGSQASLEHDWPYLLSFLPSEKSLEESARAFGAIQRVRAVDGASTLLRLALVYGFCGYSLRQTAAWAEAADIATLSDVALLKRFRKTPDWLGHLLGTKLAERIIPLDSNQSRLRLVDATTISAPGSKGTDWRVHLDFDLGAMAISEIQVTPVEGGESLLRYEFDPGELVVADRGYSHRSGLVHVLEARANFIVRWNWAVVPLRTREGQPFDVLDAVRKLEDATPEAFDLEIQPDPRKGIEPIPVRLVAVRKSPEAAAEARKKALTEASRKSKGIRPQTLELASYFLVLTSTRDLSAEQVLETYRFRWQIELVFKRLKSLLLLDHLPAKDPDLARTFLYSKLLAAILLEELTRDYLEFSPWGYRLSETPAAIALAYSASAAL